MTRQEKQERALELAKGILDYVPGDAWERECTHAEREEFYRLYGELYPALPAPLKDAREEERLPCPHCKVKPIGEHGLRQHLEAKHGILPPTCPACAKRFKTDQAVADHRRSTSH